MSDYFSMARVFKLVSSLSLLDQNFNTSCELEILIESLNSFRKLSHRTKHPHQGKIVSRQTKMSEIQQSRGFSV